MNKRINITDGYIRLTRYDSNNQHDLEIHAEVLGKSVSFITTQEDAKMLASFLVSAYEGDMMILEHLYYVVDVEMFTHRVGFSESVITGFSNYIEETKSFHLAKEHFIDLSQAIKDILKDEV